MSDARLQMGSFSAALGVNALIFSGFLLVGMNAPDEPEDEVEFIEAEMVELPRLGTKKRDPKLLPDIVQPTPPPPVEKKVASLSRKKKEEFEKPKPKPKPKEAKEKPKPKPVEKPPKKKPKKTKDNAKKRRKTIEDAFKDLDQRARDEDEPEGLRRGLSTGTSVNEKARRTWQGELRDAFAQQFRVPRAISDSEMRGLLAQVSFRMTPQGKATHIRLKSRSKNRLFDQAALAAVRRFSPSAPNTLPIPRDATVKRAFLGKTIGVDFPGHKLVKNRK